ncbi:MAG: helix-turn-helix transcriptional regulator [Liquorilactobacillus nagelii]|jgi:transcriptional regulator with XRE-family HTH domain|uniref:helix-turn-helix domain-containing protein n=1 Tax=Liquorilactobacillus nagelii TaxID=82688 RepID=UPI0024327486|nr:helix-turn-helix transcriptional regulator [Liquorilactobacillus nagelii]
MNLSEKLKHCRLKNRMTQAQVAEKLHISRKTISSWENSHSFPDVSSLVRLSDLYKISLDDLLRDERLLKSYDVQIKNSSVMIKIAKFSYNLNIIFWLLSYVEFFNDKSAHFPTIPLLLIINLIVYLTHFSNWVKFKRVDYVLRLLVTFFLMFTIYIFLNMWLTGFSNFSSQTDIYFILGFSLGKVLLSWLATVSLVVILFFKPMNSIVDL